MWRHFVMVFSLAFFSAQDSFAAKTMKNTPTLNKKHLIDPDEELDAYRISKNAIRKKEFDLGKLAAASRRAQLLKDRMKDGEELVAILKQNVEELRQEYKDEYKGIINKAGNGLKNIFRSKEKKEEKREEKKASKEALKRAELELKTARQKLNRDRVAWETAFKKRSEAYIQAKRFFSDPKELNDRLSEYYDSHPVSENARARGRHGVESEEGEEKGPGKVARRGQHHGQGDDDEDSEQGWEEHDQDCAEITSEIQKLGEVLKGMVSEQGSTDDPRRKRSIQRKQESLRAFQQKLQHDEAECLANQRHSQLQGRLQSQGHDDDEMEQGDPPRMNFKSGKPDALRRGKLSRGGAAAHCPEGEEVSRAPSPADDRDALWAHIQHLQDVIKHMAGQQGGQELDFPQMIDPRLVPKGSWVDFNGRPITGGIVGDPSMSSASALAPPPPPFMHGGQSGHARREPGSRGDGQSSEQFGAPIGRDLYSIREESEAAEGGGPAHTDVRNHHEDSLRGPGNSTQADSRPSSAAQVLQSKVRRRTATIYPRSSSARFKRQEFIEPEHGGKGSTLQLGDDPGSKASFWSYEGNGIVSITTQFNNKPQTFKVKLPEKGLAESILQAAKEGEVSKEISGSPGYFLRDTENQPVGNYTKVGSFNEKRRHLAELLNHIQNELRKPRPQFSYGQQTHPVKTDTIPRWLPGYDSFSWSSSGAGKISVSCEPNRQVLKVDLELPKDEYADSLIESEKGNDGRFYLKLGGKKIGFDSERSMINAEKALGKKLNEIQEELKNRN